MKLIRQGLFSSKYGTSLQNVFLFLLETNKVGVKLTESRTIFAMPYNDLFEYTDICEVQKSKFIIKDA
jgi:hypothetical protein